MYGLGSCQTGTIEKDEILEKLRGSGESKQNEDAVKDNRL